MWVIHEVVRSGVVEDVAVDVLSTSPLFVDKLVHDLGVQNFEHFVLLEVPEGIFPIDVKSLH